MVIITQNTEKLDSIISNSKKCIPQIVKEKFEQLDREIYACVDKKRFQLIRNSPRIILSSAGIISFKRRYYYDCVDEKYVHLLDGVIGIPKSARMTNELINKLIDLASIMSYKETGEHLSDDFSISKFTVWRTIKNLNISIDKDAAIKCGTSTVHLQVDEKYININPSKKRHEKHKKKNKKRYYTATIFSGVVSYGNKGKRKLINKSYISSTKLKKLIKKINKTLRTKYHRRINRTIFLSGDLAQYIQNMPEEIQVCRAIYVPDKFHVIRDLMKIVGNDFNEDWLYKADKLAEIVKILNKSDSKNAPKLKKLIKNSPGIFMYYKDKKYLGCSQEGQNSHIYAPRFGKYANRFLPETIEKLALVREARACNLPIGIDYLEREIPDEEIYQEICYDFSEKQKFNIDLREMKYETQKMFKNIIEPKYN